MWWKMAVGAIQMYMGVTWDWHNIMLCHTPLFQCIYHPTICFQCWLSKSRLRGLVKISVSCCSLIITSIVIAPFLMCSRKWWYFMFRCFVCGHIFGTLAISAAPVLSSNTVHWTLARLTCTLIPCFWTSLIKEVRGMTLHRAWESAMYSDPVLLNAILVELWMPTGQGILHMWSCILFLTSQLLHPTWHQHSSIHLHVRHLPNLWWGFISSLDLDSWEGVFQFSLSHHHGTSSDLRRIMHIDAPHGP